jgi:hypothetical protein
MSNVIDFCVEVSGPQAIQDAFQSVIKSAIFGSDEDGNVWINGDWDQQIQIWCVNHFPAEFPPGGAGARLTPSSSDPDSLFWRSETTLLMFGTTFSLPPLAFLNQLAESFPDLIFQLDSTEEHELCAKWIFSDGRAELKELYCIGFGTPDEWYVRDGVTVRQMPPNISQAYRSVGQTGFDGLFA